jgi:hypothetical protein
VRDERKLCTFDGISCCTYKFFKFLIKMQSPKSTTTSLFPNNGSVVGDKENQLVMNDTETILFSCSISTNSNLKVLSSSLTTLAKIGKDVILEAAKASGIMTLRCVNDPKTTFSVFEFRPNFFDNPGLEWNIPDSSILGLAIKVQIRHILSVFRALRSTEKLSLSLVNIGQHKHVMKFCATCRNGIMKTHQFSYEDVPVAMEAEFDRDNALHRIKTRPALLIEASQHLHGSDEVLLCAKAGLELGLSSYSHTLDKVELSTNMTIPNRDFERFDISDPVAQLLFSMRDFRAVLSFCEAHSNEIEDLELLFNSPGEPILLTSSASNRNSHHDDGTGALLSKYSFALIMSTLSLPPSLIVNHSPSSVVGKQQQEQQLEQEQPQESEMEFVQYPVVTTTTTSSSNSSNDYPNQLPHQMYQSSNSSSSSSELPPLYHHRSVTLEEMNEYNKRYKLAIAAEQTIAKEKEQEEEIYVRNNGLRMQMIEETEYQG